MVGPGRPLNATHAEYESILDAAWTMNCVLSSEAWKDAASCVTLHPVVSVERLFANLSGRCQALSQWAVGERWFKVRPWQPG